MDTLVPAKFGIILLLYRAYTISDYHGPVGTTELILSL